MNIASRFALKQYVEDQLDRITWDISGYQSGDVQAIPDVSRALRTTEGISEHNNLIFLRNSLTSEDVAYIDGEPIRMPWLSLLTVTDTSTLPLSIRPSADKAVFALVGTKSQMGNAYAELQNRKHFELKIENHHSLDPYGSEVDEEHEETEEELSRSVSVFEMELERTIRIERKDLNRWFLEQTSSPSLIPEIGAILVIPYNENIIRRFDALARGIVTVHDDGDMHEEAGNYFPDIIHLLKIDTEDQVSGWDIQGSLTNLETLENFLNERTFTIGPRVFIDNSTKVLLERMNDTAQKVGLISLLIALPLIWVGWILMANLTGMLLLNERRKFGLMRLRGVSGKIMGRALQMSIGSGALLGGVIGALVGTLLPIFFYEGGMLPLETILIVQQPYILLTFIIIGVIVALAVSRKLVKYASRISPLEASGRVVDSESKQANVKFGFLGFVSLVLGSYKILGWIFSYSIASGSESRWLVSFDQILDFAGFPLFVYGLVTFLVSRKVIMNHILQVIVSIIGGSLRHLTLKHISTKPQRVAGFLLIVAMMTTIGLYPTVMTAVFDNKIERGTRIQVGSDVQLTLNASDIVSNELLASGGIGEQYQAIQQKIPSLIEAMKSADGVNNATWT
ncbi:MAG: ABC transporter permease, partial [Gammaproteobacteria bacterium]|nr:ABC transporter permease [Gammaproteobacteria bacterium]